MHKVIVSYFADTGTSIAAVVTDIEHSYDRQ
jgi:hypothetical protein